MTQNIYDNPAFFTAYSHLPRSSLGLAAAPEWPLLKSLLPPLKGLRVLDLGCGYGYFSRWAAAQGATRVLALDVSERMLERARELGGEGGDGDGEGVGRVEVEYRREDLETLDLKAEVEGEGEGDRGKGAFDLVFSSLTFHYIHDLSRLFGRIHASLVPGSRMVFSIEHPIFTSPTHPGWTTNAHGDRVWGVDSYMLEGERKTNWLAEGVEVVKYHRTVGTVLNSLIEAGFQIRFARDFGPDEESVREGKTVAEERERPMFLLVAVEK